MSEKQFTSESVNDAGTMPVIVKNWASDLGLKLAGSNNRENIATILNHIKAKNLKPGDLKSSLVKLAKGNGLFPKSDASASTEAETDAGGGDAEGGGGDGAASGGDGKAPAKAGAKSAPVKAAAAKGATKATPTPAAKAAETAVVKKQETVPRDYALKQLEIIKKADKNEETQGAISMMQKGQAWFRLKTAFGNKIKEPRKIEGENKNMTLVELAASQDVDLSADGTSEQYLGELADIYRVFADEAGNLPKEVYEKVKEIGHSKVAKIADLPDPVSILNEGTIKIGGKTKPLSGEGCVTWRELKEEVSAKLAANKAAKPGAKPKGRHMSGKDIPRSLTHLEKHLPRIASAKIDVEAYTADDIKKLRKSETTLEKALKVTREVLAKIDAKD